MQKALDATQRYHSFIRLITIKTKLPRLRMGKRMRVSTAARTLSIPYNIAYKHLKTRKCLLVTLKVIVGMY